jgi:Tol biopolymer transport system component
LAPGARLGPYEVTAPIGAGGMGEVWRAVDTNLGRQVALKILPDSFAHDPDRLMRFEREARTLASLNHPNIAHIHGLEESPGARALVMELVDGEDLSALIASGAGSRESGVGLGLPLDEALAIARQIAEALEAAHEVGIIHRDLKPANIKVRADGTVKVLDFGLAKALDQAPGPRTQAPGPLASSPTITSPAMTMRGVVLGTAAYMAPEQAKGKPVDKRADIWAFGCVLYEMLTGRRAFGGEDITDTMTAVLRDAPDWSAVPAGTPAHVVRVVRRCLDKDVRQRLRDIGDARLELSGTGEESGPVRVEPGPAPRARLTSLVATGAVALVLGAVAAAAFLPRSSEQAPSSPSLRLVIDAPPGVDRLLTPQVSPDGRYVAFSGIRAGEPAPRLWLRALDAAAAEPIAAAQPNGVAVWSPDSRSLLYPEGGALVRLDVASGAKQPIARLRNVVLARITRYGATWGASGEILFSLGSGLYRVPANGGEPAAFRVEGTSTGDEQRLPMFLPDGRRFLFLSNAPGSVSGSIYVATLDGGTATRLFEADSQAVFSAGHLLFVRDGILTAQPFDPVAARLEGDAFTIASDVPINTTADFISSGLGQFSASEDGLVVHMAQPTRLEPLKWVDRRGADAGTSGPPATYFSPRLSPDARQIAVVQLDPRTRIGDIWVLDVEGTGATRLTFDPGPDLLPVWTPDGTSVLWGAQRGSEYQIYRKRADGSGAEELIRESPNSIVPDDVSPDGRVLVFRETDPETSNDLWLLPLDGSGDARPLARTPADEPRAQFSPDGRLIAYLAGDVIAQPFPALDGKWQLGSRGMLPRWRRDGRELFYQSELTIVARPVLSTVPLRMGEPVTLFTAPRAPRGSLFQVSPDGQRFLFAVDPVDPATLKYHVVTGWWAGR